MRVTFTSNRDQIQITAITISMSEIVIGSSKSRLVVSFQILFPIHSVSDDH
jgi:hypothetical protein